MILDRDGYAPKPCVIIMADHQFVGTEADRATVQRKADEARRDIPEPVLYRRELPVGKLRYDQPKRVANPRPPVEAGVVRVRKVTRPRVIHSDTIRRMLAEGKTGSQIARELKVAPKSVYNRMDDLGLPRASQEKFLKQDEPFGSLRVVRFLRTANTNGKVYLCNCECGVTCEVFAKHLRSGNRTSCGCKSKGHKKAEALAEIVTRRKAGESILTISTEMKRHRETVRLLLHRAAKTDADLAVLLAQRVETTGRPRGGNDEVCQRGHPRTEMVTRIRKSTGHAFQECRACKLQTSREAKS